MLKNYLKTYLLLFSIIIISTLLLSIFNYFFNFPTKLIKILIPIISIFISTIILGKKTKNKAYLEGIKFTSIYLLIAITLSIITKNPFSIKKILSFIIILFSGITGSMIGINLNHNK